MSGRDLPNGLKWDTKGIDKSFSIIDVPVRGPIFFYCSIVIPLTLISALLLLFKPPVESKRPPSKPRKSFDPYREYLETGWLFLLAFDSNFDSRKAPSKDDERRS